MAGNLTVALCPKPTDLTMKYLTLQLTRRNLDATEFIEFIFLHSGETKKQPP